jgi:hypothetical protein
MAVVTLWMGVGSSYITRRTAQASQTVIDQVNPQRLYEGATPAPPATATATATPYSKDSGAGANAVLAPARLKKISMERRVSR